MVDPLSQVARPADRADFHDVDDEVLALVAGSLSRVTGNAALVLRASDGVRTVREIAEAARLSLDEAASALDALARQGLVELHPNGHQVRYRKPDHLGACEDADQVALIDLRDARQHALSASGAQIWLAVIATGSLEETIAELQDAYPGESGLADHAAHFVDELVASGLLERLHAKES